MRNAAKSSPGDNDRHVILTAVPLGPSALHDAVAVMGPLVLLPGAGSLQGRLQGPLQHLRGQKQAVLGREFGRQGGPPAIYARSPSPASSSGHSQSESGRGDRHQVKHSSATVHGQVTRVARRSHTHRVELLQPPRQLLRHLVQLALRLAVASRALGQGLLLSLRGPPAADDQHCERDPRLDSAGRRARPTHLRGVRRGRPLGCCRGGRGRGSAYGSLSLIPVTSASVIGATAGWV